MTRITLPTCRAHDPGGSSGCMCRLLPHSRGLPQLAGGSASALSLPRPAQASLTLQPIGLLSRLTATFVTRLRPVRLPGQTARQLPDQSTTLWVESSSTGDPRPRGALPGTDIRNCDGISQSKRRRPERAGALLGILIAQPGLEAPALSSPAAGSICQREPRISGYTGAWSD